MLPPLAGIPNSGKSEWLDALAVNLAELHGWTIAFCSFEKNVKHHTAQLIEKLWAAPVIKVKVVVAVVVGGWSSSWKGRNWVTHSPGWSLIHPLWDLPSDCAFSRCHSRGRMTSLGSPE